jgi:hypothetical protein
MGRITLKRQRSGWVRKDISEQISAIRKQEKKKEKDYTEVAESGGSQKHSQE